MTKFKIGDVVKIIDIINADKYFGRYVGEEGIVSYVDDVEKIYVIFDNTSYAIPYPLSWNQVALVKERTIESICLAFDVDNKGLVDELKDYVTETFDVSIF